jgi:hypothetical protein
MVPNFCKGCRSRLEVTERVYCGRLECQEKARGEVLPLPLSKDRIYRLVCRDIETVTDRGMRAELIKLGVALKNHPWEDCSEFSKRRDAILEGKLQKQESPSYPGYPHVVNTAQVRESLVQRIAFQVHLHPMSPTGVWLKPQAPMLARRVSLLAAKGSPTRLELQGVRAGGRLLLKGRTVSFLPGQGVEMWLDEAVAVDVNSTCIIDLQNIGLEPCMVMGSLEGTFISCKS